jgi:hypothetical protein
MGKEYCVERQHEWLFLAELDPVRKVLQRQSQRQVQRSQIQEPLRIGVCVRVPVRNGACAERM